MHKNASAIPEEAPQSIRTLEVDVVEKGSASRHGWIRCEVGEHLNFSAETLKSYFFASWEPVIFDSFLLAAAVEFCDRSLKRSAFRWERQFRLRLPVHDVSRWTSCKVSDALTSTLQFLTGDSWTIEFRARERPVDQPAQGSFDYPPHARAVIPFSDGLDSRVVAALEARQAGGNLVHVRVGSAVAPTSRAPFAAIPYHVTDKNKNKTFRESSVRSRGFKFTLISGMAAYLAKIDRIVLPESGQGALGPVLVPVGQAYPDYRNHPLFTQRMEHFLEAILEHRLHYVIPQLWSTKGETLRAYLAQADGNTSWIETRSCWQDRRHTSVDNRWRQCGICAACMLRRMSIHAAGVAEPKDRYVWENLGASTFKSGAATRFRGNLGSLREYAIAGTLHLDHLADLRKPLFRAAMQRHALLLSHSLSRPVSDVELDLDRLLTKHSEEWGNFLSSIGSNSFIKQWSWRLAHEHANGQS